MFCTHCGNEVEELSLQCPKCGCNPQNGHNICPRCGASVNEQDTVCMQCSYPLKSKPRKRQVEEIPQEKKSNIAAGLFAIFFGTLGIHRFYMGKVLSGFLRIICSFLWIFILIFCPIYNVDRESAILSLFVTIIMAIYVWIKGIIEGIIYLTMSEEQFNEKYIYKTPKRY
ncbi:MAG: NINE protein [Thermoguttaceae bacterium]|nr:NINE protein [Thermoguttaceae bacterium]